MITTTEKKSDTIQAVEFQAQVGPDQTIRLPDELCARVPTGKDLRILVLWPESAVPFEFGTDEEWKDVGALLLAEATKDDDWNENELLKGQHPAG